jgi:hypothetical protein
MTCCWAACGAGKWDADGIGRGLFYAVYPAVLLSSSFFGPPLAGFL